MFGNQVRREGQQKQQDDLSRGFIATPAAQKTQRAAIQPTDYKTRQNTADSDLKKFQRRAADGKDHRPHRHRDGEFQRYQTGGVVH